MRFKNTNDNLRRLFMVDNLCGDFTVGWNPIRSNSLGLRLVRGCVYSLTQIKMWGHFRMIFLWGFSLSKHEKRFLKSGFMHFAHVEQTGL